MDEDGVLLNSYLCSFFQYLKELPTFPEKSLSSYEKEEQTICQLQIW